MDRKYSNERPPLCERDKSEPAKVINFDIREETEGEFKYSYYSVSVRFGQWDYSGIVNAIVSAEYPNHRMQAVINNFMQDFSSESEQEFENMQAWRDLAKKTACEVLGETPSTTYAPSLSELVDQLKKMLRKEGPALPALLLLISAPAENS